MTFFREIFIIFCALFWASCSGGSTQKREFEQVYAPKYAQGFDVATDGTQLFLRIFNPCQGHGASVAEIPLTQSARCIVCMSSSHVAFLDRLEAADRVVGVSGLRFVTTPNIK